MTAPFSPLASVYLKPLSASRLQNGLPVMGLVPGLPSPKVDPDLIFFVFLPPLLYSASIAVSSVGLPVMRMT